MRKCPNCKKNLIKEYDLLKKKSVDCVNCRKKVEFDYVYFIAMPVVLGGGAFLFFRNDFDVLGYIFFVAIMVYSLSYQHLHAYIFPLKAVNDEV
ncbi:hypothetical protein [Colwellia psychrerythraea]|uniref:hypothetical protein n=1 Tax=Colwellia psychrerythraea TaxID=28229 RepID=UPI0005A23975|nr:hypothetical protein [Colwellia psychrerythraea]